MTPLSLPSSYDLPSLCYDSTLCYDSAPVATDLLLQLRSRGHR
jgi:hypothetical protein